MFRKDRLGVAILIGTLVAAGAATAQPQPGPGPGFHFDLDFAAIDADGNEVLDRAELTAVALARIGEIDTDGDGIITRAEIVAAMPDPARGLWNPFGRSRGERIADHMLERMGAAEAGEVAAADLAERRVNALIARLDTDHDGTISADEAERVERRGHRGHHDGDRGDRGGDRGDRGGDRGDRGPR